MTTIPLPIPDKNAKAVDVLAPLSASARKHLRETQGVTVQQLIDGDRCPNGRFLADRCSMATLLQVRARLKEQFGEELHYDHCGMVDYA